MKPAEPRALMRARWRGECVLALLLIVAAGTPLLVWPSVSVALAAQVAVVLLILAQPIVLHFAKRPFKRRYAACGPHLCQHCGYDLRGIDDGHCPECGAPFNADENEAAWKAWLR
jgi:hypothetical protein